jgi:hypothetical protein
MSNKSTEKCVISIAVHPNISQSSLLFFSFNNSRVCRVCRGEKMFLHSTVSQSTLGPSQPPTQWASKVLSPGVKRPGCEADRSPSSTKVKNGGAIRPVPNMSSLPDA